MEGNIVVVGAAECFSPLRLMRLCCCSRASATTGGTRSGPHGGACGSMYSIAAPAPELFTVRNCGSGGGGDLAEGDALRSLAVDPGVEVLVVDAAGACFSSWSAVAVAVVVAGCVVAVAAVAAAASDRPARISSNFLTPSCSARPIACSNQAECTACGNLHDKFVDVGGVGGEAQAHDRVHGSGDDRQRLFGMSGRGCWRRRRACLVDVVEHRLRRRCIGLEVLHHVAEHIQRAVLQSERRLID